MFQTVERRLPDGTPDPSTIVIRAPTITCVKPRGPRASLAAYRAGVRLTGPPLLTGRAHAVAGPGHGDTGGRSEEYHRQWRSGRLWVRGQSCKLTGCMTAIDGESFPPEASGPRA